MSSLWALLPADRAAAVLTAIDALADRAKHTGAYDRHDPRNAEQRRADALIHLAVHALGRAAGSSQPAGVAGVGGSALAAAGCGLPSWQGRRPAVQVSVALSTLLELDEQPGELDGYGPIPATVARRIAADPSGTWRRLVTDDRGRLLDYGRSVYRPPQDLTDKIVARDRSCRFLHCHRPATRAQIDHRHPWADGGTTSETNLDALCSRHHHLKDDHTGWRTGRTEDGDTQWTSRTGHRYLEPAATYPIDTTLDRTTGPGPDSNDRDSNDRDRPPADEAQSGPDPPPF
jgi:hypothetical protein